ncbi:hypothetical protein [Nonomuraea sp. NPDC049607]|uniref:hypothetical protein n=1 Tax=Nonomuraea sp. NPDC049607 TaxID=3154732 RepID=UPI003418D389
MISATSEYIHSDIHSTVAHHLGGGRWAISDLPELIIDAATALRHIMWRDIEKGKQIMYRQSGEEVTPDKVRTRVQALLAEARAVLAVGDADGDHWLEARMDEVTYLLCLAQLVLGRLPGERGAACVVCQRSDRPLRQIGLSSSTGLVFACKDTCLERVLGIQP